MGSSQDGLFKSWDFSSYLGKHTKLLTSGPVLMWLEESEQHYWPWNSDGTVPWFSASLCPICAFATDVPNFPLTSPHPAAPSSHHGSSDFANTNTPLRRHQEVEGMCGRWQAATSLLSQGWKLSPLQATHALNVRLTQSLSWGILTKEQRKDMRKI